MYYLYIFSCSCYHWLKYCSLGVKCYECTVPMVYREKKSFFSSVKHVHMWSSEGAIVGLKCEKPDHGLRHTHFKGLVWFMVFNATLNNIAVISWRPVLLVEETKENHRSVASHWQILSYNVVSSTPQPERGSNSHLLVVLGTYCTGSC